MPCESMVPGTGLEPVWLAPRDFKSLVSTNFTIRARELAHKSTARAGSGIGRCSLSSCTTTYIPVAALRPHPAAARSLRFLRKLFEDSRSGGTLEARPGIEPRYTALQAAVFCSKSITYYAHPPAIRPPQISNMPVCRKSCITADMIADTDVATLLLLTCCKIWHRREHRFSSHHCRY